MKKVKTLEEWSETTHTLDHRVVWDAAQANMPIKTCGYYLKNNYWYASCKDTPSPKNDYCGKCGGETFVIQTLEQKLEAMTIERDQWAESNAAITQYYNSLQDKLGYMTLERNKLEGVAFQYLTDLSKHKVKLEMAQLHLAELVKLSIRYTGNFPLQADIIRNYIIDNGLNK